MTPLTPSSAIRRSLTRSALFQEGLLWYNDENSPRLAAEHFHRAAELGHAQAAYHLGLLLYNGEVHFHDYRQDGRVMYDTGEDPENKVEARQWVLACGGVESQNSTGNGTLIE